MSQFRNRSRVRLNYIVDQPQENHLREAEMGCSIAKMLDGAMPIWGTNSEEDCVIEMIDMVKEYERLHL